MFRLGYVYPCTPRNTFYGIWGFDRARLSLCCSRETWRRRTVLHIKQVAARNALLDSRRSMR